MRKLWTFTRATMLLSKLGIAVVILTAASCVFAQKKPLEDTGVTRVHFGRRVESDNIRDTLTPVVTV